MSRAERDQTTESGSSGNDSVHRSQSIETSLGIVDFLCPKPRCRTQVCSQCSVANQRIDDSNQVGQITNLGNSSSGADHFPNRSSPRRARATRRDSSERPDRRRPDPTGTRPTGGQVAIVCGALCRARAPGDPKVAARPPGDDTARGRADRTRGPGGLREVAQWDCDRLRLATLVTSPTGFEPVFWP